MIVLVATGKSITDKFLHPYISIRITGGVIKMSYVPRTIETLCIWSSVNPHSVVFLVIIVQATLTRRVFVLALWEVLHPTQFLEDNLNDSYPGGSFMRGLKTPQKTPKTFVIVKSHRQTSNHRET